MSHRLRHAVVRYRRFLIAAFHVPLFALLYALAFAVRFDFQVGDPYRHTLLVTLPLVLAAKLATFYAFGLFRGWWRYAGMSDLLDIGMAGLTSSLIGFALVALTFGLTHYPRGVFVIDAFLTILGVGGVRFLVRAYTEAFRGSDANLPVHTVLIVGAGTTGNLLAREIKSNDALNYEVVGFVDDDRTKHGIKVQGLRVLGGSEAIPDLVRKFEVDEVIIAIPSATGRQIRHISEICRGAEVRFRTMPAVSDLIGRAISIKQVRDVEIEDLLGREPAKLDVELVRRNLSGQTVLITGAGGSIGSELARQVSQLGIRRLVLFERSESDLHDIECELRSLSPTLDLVPHIGDILDPRELDDVFSAHEPSRVYHAAAYKHVPVMERHIVAAVRHNVIGTANVARAAAAHAAEQFLLISSDKAVRPTSLMGATKRAAERVVLGMNGGRTRYVAVRFGNVLGSRGSVIPLFKRQIAAGGPVTVTHPEMVRYFMTVHESVQLVLQASAMGQGGEVYHLDMGEQVKIVDLAENLIRLSGLVPGKDIDITFTGLRPGEKLYEELLAEGEGVEPTVHDKIRVIRRGEPDPLPSVWLASVEAAAAARQADVLAALILKAVPEFTPSPGIAAAASSTPQPVP